ncbi:hypothetical protein Tco_0530766 [Tanacetum coccineum]
MLLALTSFFFCAFSSVVTGPGMVKVEVPSAFVVVLGLKDLPYSMTSHRAIILHRKYYYDPWLPTSQSLSKAHLPSPTIDPLLACYLALKLKVPFSVDNPFQPA